MPNWRNRTPEEREAARLERQRRRAGRSDPAVLAPEPEPEPDGRAGEVREPSEPAFEEGFVGPAGPGFVGPAGPGFVGPTGPGFVGPGFVGPAGPGFVGPAGPGFVGPAGPGFQGLADEPDESVDPAVDPADLPEVAVGTRRVNRLTHPPAQRGRKPSKSRPPRARDGARPSHSRAGRVVSLVALLLAVGVIWFLVELFQPFGVSPHGSVTVTVPARASSSQVGDLLAQEGVISSSFFFELRATLAGERGSLLPGTYHLKLGMSYGDVLSTLTTPPPAAKVTELTITEGRTRKSVDKLLRAQGVKGSYLAATRHSPLLDPRRYGAPRDTPSLEGFLFPATYQLVDPIKISALVADQLRTFRQRFATLNLSAARRRQLTPYDVLIIASLIESETPTVHDRPLVASVIYNRLAYGMPLQLDSTTRYATGNLTGPLTVSELNSSSPYNTRVHKGLPPTPIDSPGLASMQAAAHPAQTSYLYFFAKPCSRGSVFASNYAQFLAQGRRYLNVHC